MQKFLYNDNEFFDCALLCKDLTPFTVVMVERGTGILHGLIEESRKKVKDNKEDEVIL